MTMVMVRLMGIVTVVRMIVTMPMFMPVVPQFGLVKQEEENQSHQQSQKQLMRPGLALKGLRQKVQKSGRHQGSGG
jgi:UDP-N-acetylmuramyl pentapeptide phosphotransferase/UDP-N-acetylglucosamine-1-phosphate transferase